MGKTQPSKPLRSKSLKHQDSSEKNGEQPCSQPNSNNAFHTNKEEAVATTSGRKLSIKASNATKTSNLTSKETDQDDEGESKRVKVQKTVKKGTTEKNLTNTINLESTTNSSKKNTTLNHLWLNPESSKYKPWAQVSKFGSERVYCGWCHKDLLIDSLYGAHGHLKNDEHLKHQEKWNSDHENDETISIVSDLQKTKLFEIDLCNMIIELNLPFVSVEPLLAFIKKYAHSASIQESKLNRHKAADIIKNEIQDFCLKEIKEKLRKNYFSLIIDEVTDITKKKFLALMVQYFDEYEGIVCKLMALKECSVSAKAEDLFAIIQEEVLSHDFSDNLIALVSDGASVMNGVHNSVLSNLLKVNPNIWYLHCICHCLHLTASKAADTIPEFVFKFIKKVYKYFCNSPKKIAEFDNLTTQMDFKVKKILKAGKTRWLSLEAAIKRLLELWHPLQLYFFQANEENFVRSFENEILLIYLEFLSVFLEKINAINLYFQNEVSEMLDAKSHLFKLYVNLSNHIFKPFIKMHDENIQMIDHSTKFNLNLDQDLSVYLMTPTETYDHFNSIFGSLIHLNLIDETKRIKLCKTFQHFILQVLKELKNYLPFDDIVLSKISTLDPENSVFQDWIDLVKSFPNIVKPGEFHLFYDQISSWMMEISNLKKKKKDYIEEKKFNILAFFEDNKISADFPLVCRLSKALLSLPHSSAAVERVFSKLKLIKNERRNCLDNDTLESLLITKVNGMDIHTKKGLSKLYDSCEDKNTQLKRRRSLISKTPPKDNMSRDNGEEYKKMEENDQLQLSEKDCIVYDLILLHPFLGKKLKFEKDSVIQEEEEKYLVLFNHQTNIQGTGNIVNQIKFY